MSCVNTAQLRRPFCSLLLVTALSGFSHLAGAETSRGPTAAVGNGQSIGGLRLGSHLRDIRAGHGSQVGSKAAGILRVMRSDLQRGQMFVTLRIDPREVLQSQLRSSLAEVNGLSLSYLSADRRWARVNVLDMEALDFLAQQPWLRHAHYAPAPILRRGAARSRAGVALRSEPLAASYTVDGSGQTVGIVSDSFAHTGSVRDGNTSPAIGQSGVLVGSRPQDSGDLPAQVRLLNDASRNSSGGFDGSDEGAAMAELVYDIAPGAEILFHSAGGNRREFADAIEALCRSGATVVVDDVLFLTETSYQDDLPAIAAHNCVEQGIAYVSAVGNDGDMAYRFAYRDINPGVDQPGGERDRPSGDDLHDWSGQNGDAFLAVSLPAGASTYVLLNWNQPSESVNANAGAQIDLDLYATSSPEPAALVPGASGFFARGANSQGTTGIPHGDAVEFLLLETGASPQTFYIAVHHFAGSQGDIPQQSGVPLEFRLLFTGSRPSFVEYDYNAPSTWGHALTRGIAAIAAVPWWESPQFDPGGYTTADIDPEPFTSLGGEQLIQFDANGNYQASTRNPPSFAGVDGNNTTFMGSDSQMVAPIDGEPDNYPNFFGTSAAAPNVAAVFALMREAFPQATPAQLIQAAEDSAIDVTGPPAAPGADPSSGAGLLDAVAAAELLLERVGRGNGDTPPPSSDPGSGADNGGANSGGGGGGGGCFIATAAYGSFIAEDVELLRDFRDRVLLQYDWGRHFVQAYYRYSPALAQRISESEWAKSVVRAGLFPVVQGLRYPFASSAVLFALLLWLRAQRRKSLAIKA